MKEYEEICPICGGKSVTIKQTELYDMWINCIFCNNGKIDWINKLKLNRLISEINLELKKKKKEKSIFDSIRKPMAPPEKEMTTKKGKKGYNRKVEKEKDRKNEDMC